MAVGWNKTSLPSASPSQSTHSALSFSQAGAASGKVVFSLCTMLSGVRKPAVRSSSRCFWSYGGISYFSRRRGNASGKKICSTSGNPFPSCRRTLPLPMTQAQVHFSDSGKTHENSRKHHPNSEPLRQCKQEPETHQTSKPRGLLASHSKSPDPRRPQELGMRLFFKANLKTGHPSTYVVSLRFFAKQSTLEKWWWWH